MTIANSAMSNRLNHTVRSLCFYIENGFGTSAFVSLNEYELRKELISCILGSQVRYEMALAAIQNLEASGVLSDDVWSGYSDIHFESLVLNVLSGKGCGLPNRGSYRFPSSRTKQLVMVRSSLIREPLLYRLEGNHSVQTLRKRLISDLPGLGPKQASMFLRNIGRSYDLAILDSHVIRFMSMQKLLPAKQMSIATMAQYEHVEGIAQKYAADLGCPTGYLDLAIWATMKAAREMGL